MRKMSIIGAAALLIGSSALGYAQKGASEYSPGDRMHDSTKNTGPGASQYAPGHKKNTPGYGKDRGRGAPESSPGDGMNDARRR